MEPAVIKVFKRFWFLQRKPAHFQKRCNDILPLVFSKVFQKGIYGFYLTVVILVVKYKLCQFLGSKVQFQVGGMAADLFIRQLIHTEPPPRS